MTTYPMSQAASRLRLALRADAALEVALGAALLLGAAPLAPRVALPPTLIAGTGASLWLFAALLWWAAKQESHQPARVMAALNLGWALFVAALLLAGGGPLTTLGKGILVATAELSTLFGLLQLFFARRAAR